MGNNIWTGAMKHQLLVCCSSPRVRDWGIFWHRNVFHVLWVTLLVRTAIQNSLGFAESLLPVWGKVLQSPVPWTEGKEAVYSKNMVKIKMWVLKLHVSLKNHSWLKVRVSVCLLPQQSSLAFSLKGAFLLMIISNIVQFFHNAVSF